jgi:hypothetical protein
MSFRPPNLPLPQSALLKEGREKSDFRCMLSINNNFIPQSEHREHAWALRTIGQDLAALRPEYLEIAFIGQTYAVSGRALAAAGAAKRTRAGKIFGVLFRRGRQRRESRWFQRRYTLADISRLDGDAVLHRKDPPFSPDIYVLGERLRTVGKMIESRNGQLVKLTLENTRVAFSYRDTKDTIHQEEHSMPSLYRSQQDGHRARGRGETRDPWLIHQPRGNSGLSEKFRLRANEAAQGKNRRS